MHITKGNKTLAIDLLPLTNTVHSILNKDFYYQISLNNNILATNALDAEFTSKRKYTINKSINLSIKLLVKNNSKVFKELHSIYVEQIKILFIGSIGIFVVFLPFIFYLAKKKKQNLQLINQLYALNEALELNLQYIKNCYFEDPNSTLPISLCPTNKLEDFDISKFITCLNRYALGYTALYQYKFELTIESSVDTMTIKCGIKVMEQILISLFHNMLYFMRGGTHIKKIKVTFTKDYITFKYDSFLANESHMANWSKGIFEQTGNLYILDTPKIFELVRKCNLSYEILPKQGENTVIIALKKMKEGGNIVRFSKNKKN